MLLFNTYYIYAFDLSHNSLRALCEFIDPISLSEKKTYYNV